MKLLLLGLGLACVLQLTLAKDCVNKCAYQKCGKGQHCVFDKEKCQSNCVCSVSCANVFCAYGNCVHNPKTCETKCVCPSICTKEYKPVCGDNHVTYGNQCELNVASCKSQEQGGKPIKKKSDGKCPCKNVCTAKYCGPHKSCSWDQKNCKATCSCKKSCKTVKCKNKARCFQNKNTCRRSCKCSRVCPRIYRPVCGSNGRTYSNECLLNYATCRSKGKITKKSNGRCPCKKTCANVRCGNGARCVHNPRTCKTECVCSKACPKIYRPVCGTDGKTYGNECLLRYATCKSKGKIQKKKDGKCCLADCTTAKCSKGARCVHNPRTCHTQCVCSKACPKILKPICGTDGKTYDNECLLNYQFCKTKGKVDKKKDGKCCSVDCSTAKCSKGARCVHDPLKCITKCVCSNVCTKIYKPVCGTDGKTYGNECQLNYAICKSGGKLKKKSDGKCPKVCPHHNPCAGIRCGYGKKCVPNFSRCAFSCQPKVCPNRVCVQPACDAKPCRKGRCIEICKNSCVHACEISRYRHH